MKTWKDAQIYCKELRGELLSIHNKTRNDEVQQYIRQFTQYSLIGLIGRDLEGNFTWSGGARLHFRNSTAAHLQNAVGGDDCVETSTHSWDYEGWNYRTCNTTLSLICKIQGTMSMYNTSYTSAV